jgi:hypothetical protein
VRERVRPIAADVATISSSFTEAARRTLGCPGRAGRPLSDGMCADVRLREDRVPPRISLPCVWDLSLSPYVGTRMAASAASIEP